MFLVPRYIPRFVVTRTWNLLVMSTNNNKRQQQQAIENLRKLSKDTKIPRTNTQDVGIIRPVVPVGMSASSKNNGGGSISAVSMANSLVTVLDEPDKSMQDKKIYR